MALIHLFLMLTSCQKAMGSGYSCLWKNMATLFVCGSAIKILVEIITVLILKDLMFFSPSF